MEERKTMTMDDIMKKLEEGVEEYFTSEKYTEYLSVMSKFTQYSFNNTILIASQRPDATLVAGYHAWMTKFSRQVRAGERGIRIVAPVSEKKREEIIQRDPKTHEIILDDNGVPLKKVVERKVPKFRIITVFDVSQTEGKELPTVGVQRLTAAVPRFDDMMEAVKKISPVPIGFEDIKGEVNGYYHHEEKRIAIKTGLSDSQTLKTAIHEVTHARLHDRDRMNAHQITKNNHEREVEAESVAFVVCKRFGLDTDEYSFPYISSWSSGKSLSELRNSMDQIRKTAGLMIEGMEELLYQQRIAREGNRYEIWQVHSDEESAGRVIPENYEVIDTGKTDPAMETTALALQLQAQDRFHVGQVLVLYAATTEAYLLGNTELYPADEFAIRLDRNPDRLIPVLAENIDDLLYDYDEYNYLDLASSREEGREILCNEMAKGNFRNVREQLELIGMESKDSGYIQRAETLLEKVSSLESVMGIEPPADKETITYYVAENMRFPVMGEYHETANIHEAKSLYDALPEHHFLSGEKGIGIMLEDAGGLRTDVPLLVGGVLQREMGENSLFAESTSLKVALRSLEEINRKPEEFCHNISETIGDIER